MNWAQKNASFEKIVCPGQVFSASSIFTVKVGVAIGVSFG
jgi:hypothetical protein